MASQETCGCLEVTFVSTLPFPAKELAMEGGRLDKSGKPPGSCQSKGRNDVSKSTVKAHTHRRDSAKFQPIRLILVQECRHPTRLSTRALLQRILEFNPKSRRKSVENVFDRNPTVFSHLVSMLMFCPNPSSQSGLNPIPTPSPKPKIRIENPRT